MRTSEVIDKLVPALLAAQKEMKPIQANAVNPFFGSSYADLETVIQGCKDILNKHGIVVIQPPDKDSIETTLVHESGQWISSSISVVVGKVNDPQAYGAGISYARRYALLSLLTIPTTDDDAESAVSRPHKPTTQSRPSNTAPSGETIRAGEVSPGRTGGTVYATQPQIKKILALTSSKGYPKEKIYGSEKVTSLNQLTMTAASRVIDMLIALP